MSIEDPQQGYAREESSVDRAEKVARLEGARREIEEWADRLGQGVDEGIKDAVALCNAMGFTTSGSCEGHAGGEEGLPVPWIDVKAPNEPKWRFEGEEGIYRGVADKYGLTLEQVLRSENDDAWREAFHLSQEREETEEYKNWRKEGDRLRENMNGLLDEFYSGRPVSDDLRIVVNEGEGGFRIHNGGKFYIPSDRKERLEQELSEEEREHLPVFLKDARAEMNAFVEFLQSKYLGDIK